MITLFSTNFVVVARLEVVPPLRAKQKPPQDCEGFQKIGMKIYLFAAYSSLTLSQLITLKNAVM